MALDDDTLQRFYDGALNADEERSVRAEVAESPQAQARLTELSRLSELLRGSLVEQARQIDSDALFRNIEASIAQDRPLGMGERLRVVGSEWFEHKRGLVVPAAASLAVAAAVLLSFLSPHEVPNPEAESGAPPQAVLVHGSSIENVDFGASTGTVFEVDSEGVQAAVVWIADDDEEAP